jgi:putative N6-adenine-specific DNA methylase
VHQETFQMVATTSHGLEEVLAKELKAIDARKIVIHKRAVSFVGDTYMMYKANYTLRTALRILKPIASFRAKDEDALYRQIQKLDWTQLIGLDDTFAINTAVFSDIFTHSKYVALKSKDAIVDLFREKTGKRPNVKLFQPTIRIHIRVFQDQFDISLDSSCESLHKRGYRLENFKAPINEVLAAGMIKLSGWEMDSTFIDPMCGSGTILAEAAMMAYEIPPQKYREYFGFMNWKGFEESTFMDVKQEAHSKEKDTFPHQLLGFDIAFQAIRMSERNFERIGMIDKIELKRKDFERHVPPAVERGIVIMNPPYGERIEADYEINAFYAMIGDQLKDAYTNYDVWMISSNKEALKCVGLRPSSKNTLFNGALECKFQCYKMYVGSLKSKNQDNTESTENETEVESAEEIK